VLRAVDEGTSPTEIIERFQVSRATIKRSVKQRRETGNVQPRPIPGRPNVKGRAFQAELGRQLEAHSGATLADHCRIWETEHSMRVSSASMSRAIHAVGWRRNKGRGSHQNVVLATWYIRSSKRRTGE
jgi:transposase